MSAFKVAWQEDGTATVLGRITARDGTGTATGVNGEGNWLKQADISTITCAVFDLSSSTPTTAIATPTVTIATHVLDTPVTTNVLWTQETGTVTGYNFLHDLPASAFPTGEHIYRAEYKITTTGGAVLWGAFEGPAERVFTS